MVTPDFRKLFIFLLLFLPIAAKAQEYYLYGGNRIDLERRPDKVAVIFKSQALSEEEKTNRIKSLLDDGDELNGYDDSYVTIKSPGIIPASQKYSTRFSQLSFVKFTAPVFYGTSRLVSTFVTDEFFVRLKDLKDTVKLDLLNLSNSAFIKGRIGDEYTFVIKTFDDVARNALEMCEIYMNSGLFVFAEPDFVCESKGFFNWTPSDPLFNTQWALKNTGQTSNTGGYAFGFDSAKSTGIAGADMNVYKAWDYIRGNQSVKVAVFDTGVDSLHPDLKDNLAVGYNAWNNTNRNKIDTGNHGTCTLGIIGAKSDNGIGIAGIAGGNSGLGYCQISSFRLVNNSGDFIDDISLARAFDTARARNFHVSSNSWGGGLPGSVTDTAINRCATESRGGKGCLIVCASGNDAIGRIIYPSSNPNTISVGASTNIDAKKSPGTGDQFWWGGNYGVSSYHWYDSTYLGLVAPTICITTDKRGSMGYTTGDYDSTFNGTSCSTPQVSGVAALVFSINPNFTSGQVKSFILRGCDKIDNVEYSVNRDYGKWNMYYGYGRVNAYNSVLLSLGTDVTPPVIIHKNRGTIATTLPVPVVAEIVDQDGSSVPSTGQYAPMLIFRKSKNGSSWSAFDTVRTTFHIGNVYSFYIPGSGYNTDVQYYIKAFDNSGNAALFPKTAPDTSSLCYFLTGSLTNYPLKIPAFSVPAAGNMLDTFVVSPQVTCPGFRISDVNVKFYVRSTSINSLTLISLMSPLDHRINRKNIQSKNYVGGTSFTGTTIADTASNLWVSLPYSSNNNLSVKPDMPFVGLTGQYAAGKWNVTFDLYQIAVTVDSIIINLAKSSGLTSPCFKHETASDTISNFSYKSNPDTNYYYAKNIGTSIMYLSNFAITGPDASDLSLISPPLSVNAGDSARIRILYNHNFTFAKSDSAEERNKQDKSSGNVLSFNTNDPFRPSIKVSLTVSDAAGPSISYVPLGNIQSSANRVLSNVTMWDYNGVDTVTRPRIYYRRKIDANVFNDNTTNTPGWKYTSATGTGGSPYTFVMDYGKLYDRRNVIDGDTVLYFITAQDISSPAYVSIKQGVFNSLPSSVNLTASAFPVTGTNEFRVIGPPLNGDYIVSASVFRENSGLNIKFEKQLRKEITSVPVPDNLTKKSKQKDFRKQSIDTDSSGFPGEFIMNNDYHYENREVMREYFVPVLDGKEYSGMLYTPVKKLKDNEKGDSPQQFAYATIGAALQNIKERGIAGPVRLLLSDASFMTENFPITIDSVPGLSSVNTLTIKSGPTWTPLIMSGTSQSIFKISNKSYITIDGSNTNGGITRDMFIVSSNASQSFPVWIMSGTDKTKNVTVKNCLIYSGENSIGSAPILVSGLNNPANPCNFDSIYVTNNSLAKGRFGIYVNGGNSTTSYGSNLFASGNSAELSGANAIGYAGIFSSGVKKGIISGNSFSNFNDIGDEDDIGIAVSAGDSGIFVERNKIFSLGYSGLSGYGGHGIDINTGLSQSNVVIRNNLIYDITGDGYDFSGNFAFDNPIGIAVANGQLGIRIYNNTINLFGNTLNHVNALSSGICIGGSSGADIRNNCIVNNLGLLSSLGLGSSCVTALSNGMQFQNIDYNVYYVNPSGSGIKAIGKISTINYLTLNDFIPASGGNRNSYCENPGFQNNYNLFPDTTNSTCWILKSKGYPLSLVQMDFNSRPRSTTIIGGPINIGAYEFTTLTEPPPAIASGAPSPGNTTTYRQGERILMEITWGSGDNGNSIILPEAKKAIPNRASARRFK